MLHKTKEGLVIDHVALAEKFSQNYDTSPNWTVQRAVNHLGVASYGFHDFSYAKN